MYGCEYGYGHETKELLFKCEKPEQFLENTDMDANNLSLSVDSHNTKHNLHNRVMS